MILTLLGRLFESVGRMRGGEAGRDLAHVGEELCRLERPRPQPAPTAR
jgi:hypothetical protein